MPTLNNIESQVPQANTQPATTATLPSLSQEELNRRGNALIQMLKNVKLLEQELDGKKQELMPYLQKAPLVLPDGTITLMKPAQRLNLNRKMLKQVLMQHLKVSEPTAETILNTGSTQKLINAYVKITQKRLQKLKTGIPTKMSDIHDLVSSIQAKVNKLRGFADSNIDSLIAERKDVQAKIDEWKNSLAKDAKNKTEKDYILKRADASVGVAKDLLISRDKALKKYEEYLKNPRAYSPASAELIRNDKKQADSTSEDIERGVYKTPGGVVVPIQLYAKLQQLDNEISKLGKPTVASTIPPSDKDVQPKTGETPTKDGFKPEDIKKIELDKGLSKYRSDLRKAEMDRLRIISQEQRDNIAQRVMAIENLKNSVQYTKGSAKEKAEVQANIDAKVKQLEAVPGYDVFRDVQNNIKSIDNLSYDEIKERHDADPRNKVTGIQQFREQMKPVMVKDANGKDTKEVDEIATAKKVLPVRIGLLGESTLPRDIAEEFGLNNKEEIKKSIDTLVKNSQLSDKQANDMKSKIDSYSIKMKKGIPVDTTSAVNDLTGYIDANKTIDEYAKKNPDFASKLNSDSKDAIAEILRHTLKDDIPINLYYIHGGLETTQKDAIRRELNNPKITLERKKELEDKLANTLTDDDKIKLLESHAEALKYNTEENSIKEKLKDKTISINDRRALETNLRTIQKDKQDIIAKNPLVQEWNKKKDAFDKAEAEVNATASNIGLQGKAKEKRDIAKSELEKTANKLRPFAYIADKTLLPDVIPTQDKIEKQTVEYQSKLDEQARFMREENIQKAKDKGYWTGDKEASVKPEQKEVALKVLENLKGRITPEVYEKAKYDIQKATTNTELNRAEEYKSTKREQTPEEKAQYAASQSSRETIEQKQAKQELAQKKAKELDVLDYYLGKGNITPDDYNKAKEQIAKANTEVQVDIPVYESRRNLQNLNPIEEARVGKIEINKTPKAPETLYSKLSTLPVPKGKTNEQVQNEALVNEINNIAKTYNITDPDEVNRWRNSVVEWNNKHNLARAIKDIEIFKNFAKEEAAIRTKEQSQKVSTPEITKSNIPSDDEINKVAESTGYTPEQVKELYAQQNQQVAQIKPNEDEEEDKNTLAANDYCKEKPVKSLRALPNGNLTFDNGDDDDDDGYTPVAQPARQREAMSDNLQTEKDEERMVLAHQLRLTDGAIQEAHKTISEFDDSTPIEWKQTWENKLESLTKSMEVLKVKQFSGK